MYKDDRYHIDKILGDIAFIAEHMTGVSKSDLENDPVLCDSMMFRLVQISENAGALSDGYKKKNPAVPWRDISGLRNRIIHDYGGVDLTIVYETLTEDIPELGKRIE